jgi:hypothetical protein
MECTYIQMERLPISWVRIGRLFAAEEVRKEVERRRSGGRGEAGEVR